MVIMTAQRNQVLLYRAGTRDVNNMFRLLKAKQGNQYYVVFKKYHTKAQ